MCMWFCVWSRTYTLTIAPRTSTIGLSNLLAARASQEGSGKTSAQQDLAPAHQLGADGVLEVLISLGHDVNASAPALQARYPLLPKAHYHLGGIKEQK